MRKKHLNSVRAVLSRRLMKNKRNSPAARNSSEHFAKYSIIKMLNLELANPLFVIYSKAKMLDPNTYLQYKTEKSVPKIRTLLGINRGSNLDLIGAY